MSKLPNSLEGESQYFLELLCLNAIFLRQGSKGLCSSYGITLGQGEDKVKVEKDSQKLPFRIQFPSIKVEQHACQVNLRGKGKVNQQFSMFTCFLKKLPTIMVEKEEGKHETREEVEKHLQITILHPPKTDFQTLDRCYKKINLNTCIFGGYKSPLGLMLKIQGLRNQDTKLHG
jgi:hypothetical protein